MWIPWNIPSLLPSHSLVCFETKMNTATDGQEDVNALKFDDVNFDKVQSLTQDEMFFLLAQRQQSGLTNEYSSPPSTEFTG